MKKNLKYVKIIVPNEAALKKIKSTPTLNRLSKLDLIVGENFEMVNHFQYSEQIRMLPLVGCIIEEIKK